MLSKLLFAWSLTAALWVAVHAIGMTAMLRWVNHSTAQLVTTGKFEQPRVRLSAAALGVALFVFAAIRMFLMPAA